VVGATFEKPVDTHVRERAPDIVERPLEHAFRLECASTFEHRREGRGTRAERLDLGIRIVLPECRDGLRNARALGAFLAGE
jgi:hypothetical protein